MDARIEFITAVNQDLWERYAQRSTSTWQHQPRIYWEPQDTSKTWQDFREVFGQLHPEPDFKHTWQRFSHKVEHQIDHLRESQADYVIWLDADVEQTQEISWEELLQLMPRDEEICSYLGRTRQYAETGWIAWNRRHPELEGFLRAWSQCYHQGYIFHLDEWHDAYVWDHLMKLRGHLRRNLCDPGVGSGEAFGRSRLKNYFTHYKGPRKSLIK